MRITLDTYRNRANWLKHGTHNVAYWSGGVADGQTVLFIHGFPSASLDWQHQWQALSGQYRLVAFDLLGFGLSDKPPGHKYTLVEQADIAERVMAQVGAENCLVVAHDYGNSVAQELLARQQQKALNFSILSMAWLNGGLFAEAHRPLLTQKLLAGVLGPMLVPFFSKASLTRSFTGIFGSDTPPTSQDIDDIWSLLREKNGVKAVPALLGYIRERKVHREKWVRAMQETRIPLCFINGVEDPISGRHMLDLFREQVPNGSCVPMDVGHYPQLEAPQEVTEALLSFWQTSDIH